ncbi:APC family permease [Propionibacteriaceae bacterium Y1685]|uniref:APC family permease n=1 Tax=Microlunatus sp. Y1700 TaxID=3418487 RepID=UPI003B7DC1C2
MNLSDAGKRLVLGRKLASGQLGETLLPKRIALPVFASDALSSVAYAPDEILITLSLAGAAGFAFSWQIALLVAVVMLVVVASYRQNVHAYPSGGGDYEVATVNLGRNAGLTVGSALLVDYILTVAVSTSSGIQTAKAVLPFIDGHEGLIAAAVIMVLMTINLRGVKESGKLFAFPTYLFMIAIAAMVVVGLFRIVVLGQPLRADSAQFGVQGDPTYEPLVGFAMAALLARTFSSGCAALTGVEAISNGVPAFKEPKSHNAATTLGLLGVVAVGMMGGIIALANLTGLQLIDGEHSVYTRNGIPDPTIVEQTAIAQLAQTVFGEFPPAFWLVIVVTMLILFLAANTAFNGFPVLGSILARDGYLPRQLHTRGDRLAYSNGIVALAVLAAVLVVLFNADVTALVQLYVVGVFVAFTTSQFGMMRHWTRHLRVETRPAERRRMKRSRVINAIGLTMTGGVLIVVLASKFIHGAWIALLAMALIFVMMKAIRRHYDKVAAETRWTPGDGNPLPSRVHAVVLVSRVHQPTLRALSYAKAFAPSSLEAVTVDVEPEETERLVTAWHAAGIQTPLTVIASPYREMTNPLIKHIAELRSENPREVVAVYVPEYVVGHWWERLMHNQSASRLKSRLLHMPGVVMISVPYVLASSVGGGARMAAEDTAPTALWTRRK